MSNKTLPDELVLAAVERAQRHRASSAPGVPIWQVKEHLGLPKRSPRLRPALAALVQAGALKQARRHGIEMWTLTRKGRCRLLAVRGFELPESPQHRVWREARGLAQQEIERLRNNMGERVTETFFLLGDEPPVHSDVWFEQAERLRHAAWVLGSATHCLREWAEPADDRPDTDQRIASGDTQLEEDERARLMSRRTGRRNTTRWTD